MILARITRAIREQNWFAVGLEFVIVVAGVYSAVWIEGHQSREAEREQTAEVIETLRGDLLNSETVERRFITTIDAGLQEWTAAYEAGERPSPYYFRIPGSDTAPANTWETLLSMGIGDVFRPDLVFDLAFFSPKGKALGGVMSGMSSLWKTKSFPTTAPILRCFIWRVASCVRSSRRIWKGCANIGMKPNP